MTEFESMLTDIFKNILAEIDRNDSIPEKRNNNFERGFAAGQNCAACNIRYNSLCSMWRIMEKLAKESVIPFMFPCGYGTNTIYHAFHTGEEFDTEEEAVEAEKKWLTALSKKLERLGREEAA